MGRRRQSELTQDKFPVPFIHCKVTVRMLFHTNCPRSTVGALDGVPCILERVWTGYGMIFFHCDGIPHGCLDLCFYSLGVSRSRLMYIMYSGIKMIKRAV